MGIRQAVAIGAVLLLSPFAYAAGWNYGGSHEPNTPYDSPTWMFPDAPTTGGKIYFNVISSTDYPLISGSALGKGVVNPNVGVLESKIEPFGVEYHTAILGVWIDCNRDGYIGLAETAAREYRNELLTNQDLCPRVLGTPNKWLPGAHNYNSWVTELIPIGRGAGSDARVYVDNETRVWGDFDKPDIHPEHRSCTLSPQARGTYQSSGGLLNFVDCRQDLLGNWNTAMALLGDPLGLKFEDTDDARTGPLGQFDTLGSEDSSHAAAYVVDCTSAPLVQFGETLNGTGLGPTLYDTSPVSLNILYNSSIANVNPHAGTGDPTVAGSANQTIEETLDDCDTSNDSGHDVYGAHCAVFCVGEADFNGVDPNHKTEAEWNFGFTWTGRGNLPWSLAPGNSGPSGAPDDLGVGNGGSRWLSDSTWLSKLGPSTVRADLNAGQVGLAPAYWLSFYAHVGAATRNRVLATPGGAGEYGSAQCGESESGTLNGWECDRNLWYINPDGTFAPDPLNRLARVGDPFELRDVDCYDGSFMTPAGGFGVQPAFYGNEPCPTM